MTRLAVACAALVALLVGHALDHTFRQEESVPDTLGLLGLAGTAAVLVVLALALARKATAGPAATLFGGITAIGFAAAHLAPEWSSALSFSYPERGLDVLSWASVLATMLAAIWVAAEGRRDRQAFAQDRNLRSLGLLKESG
ncbi:MAG TPA: hypothetical protein VGR10_06885 [Thermoleophilaceae bacterium]|nr:hypothetical protein [Thermoleophilaceae bacterium]